GTVTYTPGEDYHGTDSFTYTVTTAAGNTETATVTVTVNPVQDAFNDAVTTDEDTPVSFNVFDNDTFGPNAEVTSVTQGSHGTVSFNENGDMIYTPGDHLQSLAEGETQTDTFTYTVTTAAGNTETATVTVTINGANDAPVSTPIDGRSDFDADAINHDVSGHFSDPDASDILTFSAAGLPEGLTIDPDTGVISGTIDRSASQHGVGGVYTVTVTATDPHDASTSQTFTWTVTNPGPTAINDFGDVTEDTAITTTGNVLGNDTDPDGDPLRVDSVDGQVISEGGSVSIDGAYGTVTIDSDGSYTYDLNNTDPAIQALAHNDPYLTDTFTYTITDDEGGSSSATLTIRIHGTNDAPVISVGDGDSDSASFIETDEGLATSGTDTLSLKDIDTTNTVETSVVSVVKSGESTYHGPLPDNLIDMLTVSGGLGSGETEGKITWTFDSGTEAFDFLPAGQKLILTYTIEAKDSYGDTDTHDVTITITGTNDVGEIIDDTGNTNEDVTLTGNVLDNDIPDPDYGESLIVSGFKVDSDGDGVQENYFAGDTVTLKTSTGGGIGTFQLNANGSYTFMPHHNYSGPVPEISYKAGNLSFDGWATLKITINPVADAPKWEVHSGVETNEDEMISLNFKMPAITDNIDENGALPGDYPERLGYIELRSVDTGAKIYKGDGTTLLFTGTNNTMTIVIVDEHGNLDTTVHYTDLTSDSNYGSAIKLTQAEFEALKILPPANRHNDIDMTLRVTSYETDDSGNRDTSVPGAAASRDIHVEVLAVTDDVDLKITGSDVSYSATIDEDTTLNLSSLLSANFDDLDGSEKRSIVIYNPEGNDPIAVNGTTVNGGSSITIDAPGLSTSTTGFPAISIGGAANISGDLKGITVTLRAQDTDSDSPGHTPAVKTDSVTLDLYVNPVAGDVTAPPVSTEEDTAVKFMEDLALTDTDGSEVMDSITIKAVPTGWVIKDSGGAVVHTGDGSSDYSVPAAHVSEGSYKDYTITPPAHSSADETLTVSVQTTDTKVVGGTTVTSTETVDLGVKVTVTPVAEVVGGDSDGDGTPDLTMTSGHIYGEQVEAYEDEWFNLNQDGFNLKDGWHNQDGIDVVGGTEKTFALLTPVLDGGSANGSKFTYNDGATTHTLIYNGTAVEIPMEHLDTVQFMAPENVSGHFEIQVQAKTIDTDPDDPGATDTAISGSATLANLVVLPVADQVTLAVSSSSRGLEDSEIALKIKPTSSDPSETFRVTLSGIPDGAVLKYGGGEQTVTGGEVTIDDFDSNESLTIQPPLNSNEDFTLKASAVSVDTLDGYTDVSASSETLDINVVVKGVPDEPDVIVQDLERTEDQVDLGSGRISLSDIITKAEPTDSDGSEKLTMTLTGLDPQFTIEGATFLGGSGTSRTWLVCQDELTNPSVCPKVVVPENYSGTIDMKVRPVTTEDDGASRTWDWIDVTVKVTPSPEATMALSTTTFEDTPATVNFSIVHLNGDIDEELSSVWIKEAGDKGVEGKEFTLYLGDTGTTLSAAAGQAGSGVVLEDGWYKLTGAAIDNVYAKGGANASGSYSFDVRYEVTDPSSDGSPLSVSSQTDDTYTLTVRAVTDATETSLGEFEFTGNASVDGTTVTAEGNTSISIPVTVTQQPDPDAGNEPDTDGSERLVRFVIDGVPDGVSVEGGVYIGDIPGYTNTGQWLIEKNVAFNGTDQVTEDIVFHLEGSADLVGGLNETITITAVTQDTESFEFRSGASWTLVTAPKGEFDDDGATPGSPAQIITYEPTDAGMMEDTPKVLNDLVDFEITGSSPFSITLTHLPPGTVVEGMTQTTVDGQTVWTASGTGGNAELQALLDGITVTPPENWNDNNHPGEFSFSVHLTTYAEGGQQHDHPLTVSPAIEPVTDPALIVVSAPDVYEGDPVPIALVLSNSADGEYSKIVDGKLYITLNESKMDSDGSLWYGGSEIDAQFVSGVDGITDGVYFVIGGVSMGETINLEYRPSDHASGSVSLTASLVSQEDGAANSIPTTVNDTFWVNAVNSGFQVTAGNVSGDEDTPIVLNIGGSGLVDTDGSESTISAVLSNVPEDFLVFVGADAESAAMAANLGGEGSVNSWSLPLDASGQLPAYVAILPPENWSGTIENIALTVYSGESSLEPTADTATFDLEVIPVADGVNLHPTLTFGTEGSPIPLNLNATMIDSDGSETVTLSVQGLGQYAAFHAGGSLLDFSYNSGTDTYTISGIDQGSINDITFIQSSVTGSVTVEAKTVETLNNDASGITSGSFQVNISEVVATAGNDTFLYDGTRSYDGGDGIDTLVLRYGEDIDFSTNPDIKNMEIIDLASSGYDHTLNNLSVQDVLDITDSNNDLWILGDGGDSVNIVDDGEWSISLGSHVQEIGGVDITFDVYTHAIHTDVILRIQQEMMANLGDAPPEP
ncbi:MAG: VCBS domain-containing protein, partial [Synergistales bacterium]|nr:VCBS domain-containing protein [Synergistales bacterium]